MSRNRLRSSVYSNYYNNNHVIVLLAVSFCLHYHAHILLLYTYLLKLSGKTGGISARSIAYYDTYLIRAYYLDFDV